MAIDNLTTQPNGYVSVSRLSASFNGVRITQTYRRCVMRIAYIKAIGYLLGQKISYAT